MSDKRALRNQYKEQKPAMGIFEIRNRISKRAYIDASLNLNGAMNRHRFELTMKTHRNRELQQDWLAHGAESFSFEVIDTIKPRDEPDIDYRGELAALLDMWRDEYRRRGENGYQRSPADRPASTLE
jgi:hypothetical protein